jgi:putative endonuclease
MTNWSNKVLYIGITNNLVRRCYEHKHKIIRGFTEKYNVNKLVYFDTTNDVSEAIKREKQLKGWTRSKKINLVESINPMWNDLSERLEG